jgi:hypothetical protein
LAASSFPPVNVAGAASSHGMDAPRASKQCEYSRAAAIDKNIMCTIMLHAASDP